MSDISDQLGSGPTGYGSTGRRLALLGAAVAVIVAAGVGGVVVAQQANQRPSGTAAGTASASSSPSPRKAAGSPSPSSAPTSSATVRAVRFPPAAEANIGGSYWAVYLALPRTADDPKAAAAERQVVAAGIRLSPGVDYGTVKLLFKTRQDAEAFVAAYQPGVIGTAPMTWACAD